LGLSSVAEGKKKQRRKKKRGGGRRKFSSAEQARAQLEGITAAQNRYRRAKRSGSGQETSAAHAQDAEVEGIIIESREKSEQAWKNVLRSIRRPEDLDGFE